MLGSSPKTSSPTFAVLIASRIAGVGWVIVSLRKSRRSAASISLGAVYGSVTAMAVPWSVNGFVSGVIA